MRALALVGVFFLVSSLASAKARLEPVPFDCHAVRSITLAFVRNHYLGFRLDSEFEDAVARKFAELLDPRHELLDEASRAEARRRLHGIFSKLGEDCSPIARAHEVLVERLRALRPGSPEADSEARVSRERLHAFFLDSVAAAMDGHSEFLDEGAANALESRLALSRAGVAARFSYGAGAMTVEGVEAGSALERSGLLRRGDRIVSFPGLRRSEIENRLSGEPGTRVELQIERGGARRTVSVPRETVRSESSRVSLEHLALPGSRDWAAMLRIPSFYADPDHPERSTSADVAAALDRIESEEKPPAGVILDLTRNNGGLLEEAIPVAGLFAGNAPIVAIEDSNRDRLVRRSAATDPSRLPLIILVSDHTASAAEILSGSLQALGRAWIIGSSSTFGKGTAQTVLHLPPGLGALRVTTDQFFLPNGRSTQLDGVEPDLLAGPPPARPEGERFLEPALPSKVIPSIEFGPLPAIDPAVGRLRRAPRGELCPARQACTPESAALRALAWLRRPG